MTRFPLTSALLSGSASAHEVDEIAWLLEGGPANRTAYMAGAAKRAAARVETAARMAIMDKAFADMRPVLSYRPATDVNYPLNCGSKFD